MGCFAHLPFWPDDKDRITSEILKRPGDLKIIIKVRDEVHFLTEWMAHHADIVGYENIIIFDNLSVDPQLADYYNSLPSEVTIARYHKMHNMLHVTSEFPELYDALSKSCLYFVALDCDEFLVHIADDLVVRRDIVVDFLKYSRYYSVFPTTWLENGPRSRAVYKCESSNYLGGMIHAGKPIIRANAGCNGWLLHNYHIDSKFISKDNLPSLFVQHRLNLFPERRIEANIVKMLTEGLIPERWTVDKILAHEFPITDNWAPQRYQNDIRRLSGPIDTATVSSGYAEFRLGRKIQFFSPVERDAFYEFRHPWEVNFVQRWLKTN